MGSGFAQVFYDQLLCHEVGHQFGMSHSYNSSIPVCETRNPGTSVEPERRQLTVVFCDLVDSTALSTRLDPEDLRQVVGRYHQLVCGVIQRFGGFPAQFMGDGVMAFFGYPTAHEDDAEHAVRVFAGG